MPFNVSREEFEEAVDDAIDLIPDDLARAMDNVAIFVVEEYEPAPGEPADTELLGLYEGTPLTERDSWWDAGSLPDRISIFRGPLMRLCASREELVEEILVTVVHEVAHHFGIDDERLHELGWN
ncbi:metallopeptidase family protein [Arthrobacter sp. Soc17.1.1.1]|uniref:metallopeptidase family protein n=1 Tax=Arthrobacter sp. Soc17.1.1.1 TaxID=3121277 RepID=UPI002FE4749E